MALKAEMAKINKNLMKVLQINQVKSVAHNCETCGGPHSYNDFPPPLAKLGTYMLREPIINVVILTNLKTNMTSLTNSNLELKNMFGQFIKMNTASSSGLRTLPSNIITNQKEDLNITTRTGNAYKGPTIPATSSPTKVVKRETEVTKDTTKHALINVMKGELTLRVGNKAITFNLDQTSRYFANYDPLSINRIDLIDLACKEYSQEVLRFFVSGNPTPSTEPIVSNSSPTLTPFEDSDFLLVETDAFLAIDDEPISLEIDEAYYDSEGDILLLGEFLNDDPSSPPLPPQELKLVEPTNENSSIDEPPVPHLEYAFLEGDDKLPIIISKDLKYEEKIALIKILMEDDFKPAVQHQRKVNLKIYKVIKKECGFTVLENEENELIPTRLVMGWRVCINYQMLNDATHKDHFPLPFMDQMLERLAGNKYYCFLDGFSGYFQIPIELQDQEKTTFTCPYRTFAYRRMPFGLFNAPDIGSPRADDHEYLMLPEMLEDPYVEVALQEPLSPDLMPGPEEPEQAPPSPDYIPGPEHADDAIVAEDQPYAKDASPIAQSPELLAISTPPASPLSPWSSPPPQIPSPPLPPILSPPSPILAPAPPPSPIRSLGYRAAMIRLRDEAASTSPPSSQLPSTSRREDRPEVTLPPRKRLDIALGPRYEVGESLSAAAARPANGFRADYGFVAAVDREIMRDPEREVGYGITDSWDEIVETLQGAPVSTDTELGGYVREFETRVRQEIDETHTRLDDEQTKRQLLAGWLSMLFRDRHAHAYTRQLMETEARMSKEAWVRATDASDLV
nr:reverse transcriptase domain-containing protein [Tanacetum cinerariifolium]